MTMKLIFITFITLTISANTFSSYKSYSPIVSYEKSYELTNYDQKYQALLEEIYLEDFAEQFNAYQSPFKFKFRSIKDRGLNRHYLELSLVYRQKEIPLNEGPYFFPPFHYKNSFVTWDEEKTKHLVVDTMGENHRLFLKKLMTSFNNDLNKKKGILLYRYRPPFFKRHFAFLKKVNCRDHSHDTKEKTCFVHYHHLGKWLKLSFENIVFLQEYHSPISFDLIYQEGGNVLETVTSNWHKNDLI